MIIHVHWPGAGGNQGIMALESGVVTWGADETFLFFTLTGSGQQPITDLNLLNSVIVWCVSALTTAASARAISSTKEQSADTGRVKWSFFAQKKYLKTF
jgi:hypothetical protein